MDEHEISTVLNACDKARRELQAFSLVFKDYFSYKPFLIKGLMEYIVRADLELVKFRDELEKMEYGLLREENRPL